MAEFRIADYEWTPWQVTRETAPIPEDATTELVTTVFYQRPGYDQGQIEEWVMTWTDLHQHFIDDWIIPIAGQPAPFTMPPNAGISGAGYEG